jgi:hypothetical protein
VLVSLALEQKVIVRVSYEYDFHHFIPENTENPEASEAMSGLKRTGENYFEHGAKAGPVTNFFDIEVRLR